MLTSWNYVNDSCVWNMLTNSPVKGAYDMRQEVPIGVCIRLVCLAHSIMVLKVIRVGHFKPCCF
uniref:Uncharacterized protein n=1 Tax=Arundo donax TaxID=35708 RepID=A0A0A9FKV6_ARUDO